MPLPGVPRAGDAPMKVTIDVPDDYAEQVRRLLLVGGYCDDPAHVCWMVRRHLREALRYWWEVRADWRIRARGNNGDKRGALVGVPPPVTGAGDG